MSTHGEIRISPEQIDFNDRCNLLFHINKDQTATEKLSDYANQNSFWEKEEVHLTVIGSVAGKFIKEAALTDEHLLENVFEIVNQFEWSFIPEEKYFRIEKTYTQKTGFKEKRESIIQKVQIPAIQDFYKKLNELLGTTFDAPFTHITLYIKSNYDKQKEGIGIASEKDFKDLHPKEINLDREKGNDKSNTKDQKGEEKKVIPAREKKFVEVKTIQLPTRPQVDTLITFFIIDTFGKKEFGTISEAQLIINPLLPEGESFETLLEKGTLCVDLAQGPFDHHNNDYDSSAQKAAAYFNEEKNPALAKLLELAARSEKGKGTMSQDPLDKMFGFDGLVMTLNKVHQSEPKKVITLTKEIIDAYYKEAYKRTVEYPKSFDGLAQEGKGEVMTLKLNGKPCRTCIVETTESGFIGYIRAQSGGKCELVVQIMPTGHMNILTRMNNGINLAALAYIVRSSELILQGKSNQNSDEDLTSPERLASVPEWYYDKVTNSLLNGGIHPEGISPTKISRANIKKLLEKWQSIYTS